MNEYDDLLAGDGQREQVRQSLYGAVDTNPDQYAEARRLSRSSGIPAEVVARNPETVKRKVALNEYDALLADSPKLAQRIATDKDFARVSHDDVGTLTAIEQSFRKAQTEGRAVRGKIGETFIRPGDQRTSGGRVGETFIRRGAMQGEERSFVGGITEPVRRGLAQGDRGLTMLLSEMGALDSTKSDLGVTLANQQRQVERFPVPTKLQDAMSRISGAETMGTAASQIMRNPRAVLEVTLQSLGASAPALVGAVVGSTVGPAGTAAGAGLGSFAVEYAATIQEVMGEKGVNGLDPLAVSSALNNPEMMAAAREKAVKRGIPIAIFDALTAGVAGRLLAGAKGTVASAGTRAAGELGIQAGGGAAGEAVAQAATGEYKPGDILLEALAEMPSALVEVPANIRHAQGKAQQAEQTAVAAEKLVGLADASKLRQRDPEAFKQFLTDAAEDGDAPSEFYIDAEQLTNSLNQSAITIEQLRAFAPAVAQQIEAGFVPGADIRVPLAEFAAADPKIAATLIEHLREAPDAMSRAEAQAFMQEQGAQIEQEVQGALQGEAAREASRTAADTAGKVFEEQLTAAGRFRPEVNKAYATVLGNFYATQAERAGVPVEEFLDRYQLRVTNGKGTAPARQQSLEQDQQPAAGVQQWLSNIAGMVKQLLGGEQNTLNQSAREVVRTPEFRKWFGASAAVDDAGKPKILYHGTADDFTEFKASEGGKNVKTPASRVGFFFVDRPDIAERYAQMREGTQQVMPVYLSMQNPVRASFSNMMEADRFLAAGFEGDGAILEITTPSGSKSTVYAVKEATQIKSAFNGGQFDPSDPNILNQISPAQALALNTPLELPTDPLFAEAVQNTPGASVTEDGLLIDVVRFQKPEQEGAQAIRTGVFYLPAQSKDAKHYKGKTGYGGTEKMHGETLLRRPLFVKGATGGNAIKAAYDQLKGKGAYEAMRDDVLKIAMGYGKSSQQKIAGVEEVLRKYGGDAGMAYEIVSVSREGNTLPYAVQEHIAAHAVREAGYDSVLGYSKGRGEKGAFLSEVFDVREQTFPARGMDSDIHDAYLDSMAQGPRGTLSFGNDITAVPSIIALMEGADLSTFLHESGHLFLEIQADLAARIQSRSIGGMNEPTASEQQIVADMNVILEWMGIPPAETGSRLDAWLLMSLEEKREHHESWARGFERYLMEGKAPSQELQGLFSKFRSWLISVYKALSGLNVDLSDEVRQVMGRMMASDAAIEEAQMARNMGPLFESPEQSGMTPEDYVAYQALGQQQTAQASAELDARLMKDMKWLSRARDKALKARQAEVDDLRREVEREVRAEVMSAPVYQAWQFLTGKSLRVEPGIQAIETVDPTTQSGKLRTKYLKESNPDEWKILSERRMTSDENGMDPEQVAAVFPEFTSADEMVKALASAPAPQQLIEELVDQQMLERYGDITSPEALSQAADEAVHNEMRARVVATELKALEKATTVRAGKRSTIDAMARAAKEFAYAVIVGQRVRDLRPSQYSAAQARSAKLAMQALGKSTEEAAMHKRNELINGYAAKAAYDAQEEVRALQKYMRKFDKRIDSIDPGYQDQIEQLLERFDFRPASLKAIDKRKSFAAWYAEQEAAGNAPSVPDELLDEASRKSYKDMTVEELRGLRDTVKQIEHQGRLKKKLLLARDARDFDAIAADMAASIIEHGGEARPVQLEGPNPVMDWFAGAWASHRKLASLFRQMDGNKDAGPMWEYIGRSMNEQSTVEDVALEQATVKLRELYAPLLKMRGGITGYRSKVFIPEINASLTRGGRLAVALNWGNEANRQRIMDGDKWSVGQVQAILKTLSPAELEFVNQVWEFIDSYWPEIAAKEKRLTGVEPEKVEAAPFNVLLPDGTEVAMRGGYYPLKYDTDRSDRADQQEAAQAAKEMMQGVFSKATTRRGHTKERLKEVKRAVRKDLNVITQHVTQVVHDLAWHEWLIDTNKLFGDDRIVSAIRDHYGPKVLKTMRDDVLGIATADVAPQTDVDKALLALRSNVTRATMGASVTTAFLQPFGLTQSIVRIGGRHVLRGLARWGGDAARMESAVGWIHERSEFMRLRSKTFNRELREIRGSVAGKSATMRAVDAGLFVLMQKMQTVADVPTWLGQYEKSTSEGLPEADAVAMADRAVLESQGGGNTKDMAEVQRKHPMLTQFYSYFSVTLNLAAEQTAATDFKNPAAVAGWLGDMALLMVIPAILPSFILYSLRGGDDDDDTGLLRRVAEWQVSYLLGTVVGLRELSGAVGGFDYAGPPVGRIIGDIGKAGKQTAQGEIDEPLVLAYARLMGDAFGIPMVQILRSYKGWKAWDEGQEGAGPQSILLGPPPKE